MYRREFYRTTTEVHSTGLHAQHQDNVICFRPSTTHALRHMLRSNTKCLTHASHTAFRTLLRSSSLQEPRDPLLRVFVIRRLPHDHAQAWAGSKTPVSSPTLSLIPPLILPQVHLRKPCYDFYFL